MAGFRSRLAALFTLCGCLAGCSDPLDQKVPAATAGKFAAWRAHIASDSSAAIRGQVDAAVQEIRQTVAGERELKRRRGEPVEAGIVAIDEGVRERVDGRPLRDVVQLGLELKVNRLKAELAGLEDVVDKNDQLLTRPGDTEARRILDDLRGRQTTRIEKYREELTAAEGELAPLLKARGSVLPKKAADLTEVDDAPQRVR